MQGEIYIPHMSMSPSQSPWPFKLIRRQFPIITLNIDLLNYCICNIVFMTYV